MNVTLRPLAARDIEAVFAIYDDEVLRGTATFDTAPSTPESRAAWLSAHGAGARPAIVAVGDGGEIAGYAALSAYSDRLAYARTAENSVYVHRAHRGRGIGRLLLAALLGGAREAGISVLVARITTESVASRALHVSLGFRPVGTLRRVGEKFGRILDVEILDRHLDEDAPRPGAGTP